MTNLTEQWEKGELTGEYWCEITESPYPERVYLPACDSDIIVKVLAPVPSYEEWKSAYECQLMESELVLTLKGLLKECRNCIDTYYSDLIKRIDEVLK